MIILIMPKVDDAQFIELNGVKITHPNKVLYTDLGITKLDVAKYYQKVAKYFIPHLIDRPMSLVRTPEGIDGARFFQKHPSESFPNYIERIAIKEKQKSDEYILIDNLNDILYLVNLGTLEFHTWNSKIDDLEHPDRIVFDLDPAPDAPFATILKGCLLIKNKLEDRKLLPIANQAPTVKDNYLKTSGNKGYHIVVSLKDKYSWSESKDLAKAIAQELVNEFPEEFTIDMRKEKRIGKVFIDYLRNERGATTVAAFSTRAKPHAPISVPIKWEDLSEIKPNKFNINNIDEYLQYYKKL